MTSIAGALIANALIAISPFPLVAFKDIRRDTERRGYLVRIAAPKCGKSFWLMDVAFHVSLGWEYHGRRVQQATVVYVALEGRNAFQTAPRHSNAVMTSRTCHSI
jgi:hypothetical protein